MHHWCYSTSRIDGEDDDGECVGKHDVQNGYCYGVDVAVLILTMVLLVFVVLMLFVYVMMMVLVILLTMPMLAVVLLTKRGGVHVETMMIGHFDKNKAYVVCTASAELHFSCTQLCA